METAELIRTIFIIMTIFCFFCALLSHCISKQKKIKSKKKHDLFYKDIKMRKVAETVIGNTFRNEICRMPEYDELIDRSQQKLISTDLTCELTIGDVSTTFSKYDALGYCQSTQTITHENEIGLRELKLNQAKDTCIQLRINIAQNFDDPLEAFVSILSKI